MLHSAQEFCKSYEEKLFHPKRHTMAPKGSLKFLTSIRLGSGLASNRIQDGLSAVQGPQGRSGIGNRDVTNTEQRSLQAGDSSPVPVWPGPPLQHTTPYAHARASAQKGPWSADSSAPQRLRLPAHGLASFPAEPSALDVPSDGTRGTRGQGG